jgi:hypothetical protein
VHIQEGWEAKLVGIQTCFLFEALEMSEDGKHRGSFDCEIEKSIEVRKAFEMGMKSTGKTFTNF